MDTKTRLGFTVTSSKIKGRVFIPRYYDRNIVSRLEELRKTHELVSLGDLLNSGSLEVSSGHEIGKMAYGTGHIPFVRTSDISNWEIKADPKQGVRRDIYERLAARQDVKAQDVLFVRDGTYLIGASALVTHSDEPMLFQSHILKFRAREGSFISGPLLLALLSTPIVKRQIRSKQFTADIIDTIGNRYRELVLPLPQERRDRNRLEKAVNRIVEGRNEMRERLRRIPLWAQGLIVGPDVDVELLEPDLTDSGRNLGFVKRYSQIRKKIFVPRYYNPDLEMDLKTLKSTHHLKALGELAQDGTLEFRTGIEVGKMAYGTGPVPFIRTSDISNWEIKIDPKQDVSEAIFERFKSKLDVQEQDVFVVRDGTYLVGTSCMVTRDDTRVLYCAGLYKVRSQRPEALDPYLLFALLNTPIVRRQIRAKQFTRDIIDTVGHRILEVLLPVPKSKELCSEIASETRKAVETRATLRLEARNLVLNLEGSAADDGAIDSKILQVL